MIYFTIIFLTIVIILFSLKEKNLTNPAVIFSGIWLISLGLTSLKLYNMISYSTKSILIVTMGIVSFAIGTVICIAIWRKIEKKEILKENSENEEKINNILFIVILTIGLIMVLILSIKVIILLANGTSYYNIRKLYYSYGENGSLINNDQIFTLFDWTMSIIITLSTPVVIVQIMKKQINKIAIAEYCVMIAAYVFATSGRMPIFIIIVEVILYLLLNKENINLRLRRIAYGIVGTLAAAIICITVVRTSSSQNKKVNALYEYFSLPLPYFSKLVDYIDKNEVQTYGAATGYGPYLLVQKGIKVVTGYKFKNAEQLAKIITKPQTYWVKIFQDTKDYYNAYATLFYYFYLDFRYVGVVIFSCTYGMTMELVYLYYKKKKSIKMTIIYMMVMTGIIQSFATWQFMSPAIIISLILSNFIVKKEKQK